MKKESKDFALWIIGSEISFMIGQTNKYPTVEQVRNYPAVALHCQEIDDSEIERVVNNIRKMDERTFVSRHEALCRIKPNYYGFKRLFEDENGEVRIKFITNDDLCKKLAERLLNS